MATNVGGDNLIYHGAGPLAALLLGMALVPVREFTTASRRGRPRWQDGALEA